MVQDICGASRSLDQGGHPGRGTLQGVKKRLRKGNGLLLPCPSAATESTKASASASHRGGTGETAPRKAPPAKLPSDSAQRSCNSVSLYFWQVGDLSHLLLGTLFLRRQTGLFPCLDPWTLGFPPLLATPRSEPSPFVNIRSPSVGPVSWRLEIFVFFFAKKTTECNHYQLIRAIFG